jgi:hypothetical protein
MAAGAGSGSSASKLEAELLPLLSELRGAQRVPPLMTSILQARSIPFRSAATAPSSTSKPSHLP